MLEHEYALLHERLAEERGRQTNFFAFADTVSARNYQGTNECHGWMGVRFQREPGEDPNDIIIHVRMWDRENVLQQEALGIVGVNLLYAAFHTWGDHRRLIASLIDQVGSERVEVDMIKCTGPAFQGVDQRLMALQLVQQGLTNAVMFGRDGEVRQPSEVLYRKAVLVERGSFRPVTHVHVDMLTCATAQFLQEPFVQGKEVVVLMEITMNNLLVSGDLDPEDFLARVDMLAHIGFTTLISNYSEFYRLVSYFRRYTREMIGVAMGINTLVEVFNERYYENLEGGVLEACGRLFRQAVKLYVYPMGQEAYERYVVNSGRVAPAPEARHAFSAHVLITAKNLLVAKHLRNLYAHLLENHNIDGIVGFDPSILHITSRDVLQRIKDGDIAWEQRVPQPVAGFVKRRGLFGWTAEREKASAIAA